MRLHFLFLFIAIGLSLNGCKSSTSPNSSVTISQLFPLSVGNSWIVRGQNFDTSGIVIKDQTFPLYTITGTQQFHGQLAYQAILGTSTDTDLFYISGTDLYDVSNPNSLKPAITQYLRYPMNVGESLPIDDSTKLILRSINESVTVPANTFSCYHYDNIVISFQDTLEKDELYFAPGVGMVKYKNYSPSKNGLYLSTQLSLESYVVK